MARTTVEVKDEDGRTVKYEGVLVGELLKRAGATLGSDMRGERHDDLCAGERQ